MTMIEQATQLRERVRGAVGTAQARVQQLETGTLDFVKSVRGRYTAGHRIEALRADVLALRTLLEARGRDGLTALRRQVEAVRSELPLGKKAAPKEDAPTTGPSAN
jgi:hypothetical protein